MGDFGNTTMKIGLSLRKTVERETVRKRKSPFLLFEERGTRVYGEWCRGRDLNSYGSPHTPLKRACLPIPPPRQREAHYTEPFSFRQLRFCFSRPSVLSFIPPEVGFESPWEALNNDLWLSLDSGHIKLCEAPCWAVAALFRDSLAASGKIWPTDGAP